MYTSGETAKSTSSDTAITLLSWNGEPPKELFIINESAVPGWFSFDGTTWAYLPQSPGTGLLGGVRIPGNLQTRVTVYVKRRAGGSNVTGLYAFAI